MTAKRLPLHKQATKINNKYSLELGRMVAEWNFLHDSLAYLFWQTTGIFNGSIPLAIWNSTNSDLSQRKMLKAVAEERYAHDKSPREEILWLISKIDTALANRRNDATHAPVATRYSKGEVSIVPVDDAGNPRAKGLVGKDVIKEIVWYRKMAAVLNEYAIDLHSALVPDKGRSLPPRPLLPTLNQRPPAKGKHRATPRKEHGHPRSP